MATEKASICNTVDSYPALEIALISRWSEAVFLGMTGLGTALKSYRETNSLAGLKLQETSAKVLANKLFFMSAACLTANPFLLPLSSSTWEIYYNWAFMKSILH